MSFIGESPEHQKELRTVIGQAMDMIEYHFEDHSYMRLTFEQCQFVLDYLFSVYQVDDFMQQKIRKQMINQDLSTKQGFRMKKQDLGSFLLFTLKDFKKRNQQLSMDDIMKYIDVSLIKKLDSDWARLNKNEQSYVTKPVLIDLLGQIIRDYRLNFQKCMDIINDELKNIYKYVFFEDLISIIIQISKSQALKKRQSDKQDCGCTIF